MTLGSGTGVALVLAPTRSLALGVPVRLEPNVGVCVVLAPTMGLQDTQQGQMDQHMDIHTAHPRAPIAHICTAGDLVPRSRPREWHMGQPCP